MKKRLSLFLALALLFLPSCLKLDRFSGETAGAETGILIPQGELGAHVYEDEVYFYQSNTAAQAQNVLMTGLDRNYLVLVNKEHAVGQDYEPDSLVRLDASITAGGKEIELEARTAEALNAMLAELYADGITTLMVTSGYRTYRYQADLYNTYLKNEQATISKDAVACLGEGYIQTNYRDKGLTGLTYADAEKVVLSYSAFPGTSEHQTGLCVDFITTQMTTLDRTFEEYDASRWLLANAYRFGFILRYPEDKTGITGYSYEPWHYRFVGREAATDIYRQGLTLEEYLNP